MSEHAETAKAVQESAKLGREMLAKLGDLERIGANLLGPFGQGWGILTDLSVHLREEVNWRLENRRSIYLRAKQKADAAGIDLAIATPVPPRVAYSYEAGLETEDDPTLQDLWANLLVNVTKPENPLEPQKIYKDLLERMAPDDAGFFRLCASLIDVLTLDQPERDRSSLVLAKPQDEFGERTRRALVEILPGHRTRNAETANRDYRPFGQVTTDSSIANPTKIPAVLRYVRIPRGGHEEVAEFQWDADRTDLALDRVRISGLIKMQPRTAGSTEFEPKFTISRTGWDLFYALKDPT